MKRFSLAVLFVVLSMMFVTAMPAVAQQNTVLNVHIEKAVAIPGHVLLPGNYLFRLRDADTYPGFVQVTSADGSQVFGFVQVFPAWRPQAGNDEVVLSQPDAAGLENVEAWYFQGEHYGYHFVYSQHDLRNADLIAQRMHTKSNAGL